MRIKSVIRLTACAMAAACLFTGCGGKVKQTVIAEKETRQSGEESSLSPSGDQGKVYGAREQAEAPERYTVNLKTENLVLYSEAPVNVPDVKSVSVKNMEAVNFTREEYERAKQVLADELGVNWEEETAGKAEKTVTVNSTPDSPYPCVLSYKTDYETQFAPYSFIWMNNFEEAMAPVLDSAEGEAEGGGEKLEQKAAALLERIGFGNYGMRGGRWVEPRDAADGEPRSEKRYHMIFTPVVEGIPCVPKNSSFVGSSLRGSYADVTYSQTGRLIEFKLVDKELVAGTVREGVFLLPFQSIKELFEQYCKTSYENRELRYEPGLYLQEAEGRDAGPGATLQPGAEICAFMTVNHVEFEYAFSYREGEGNRMEVKSELIPVWNFYGNLEVGCLNSDGAESSAPREPLTSDGDTILLSINAEDGSINIPVQRE